MPRYMLLLHGDTTSVGPEGRSPEEIQAIIEKYVAWSTGLEEQGRWVASDKLRSAPARTLLGPGDGLRVVDGPYTEAREVVAGYFIIEAQDLDEAASIAQSCPHLTFGGHIEVREVEPRVRERANG